MLRWPYSATCKDPGAHGMLDGHGCFGELQFIPLQRMVVFNVNQR